MAPAPAVPLTKDPEHETPDPLHPGRSPSGRVRRRLGRQAVHRLRRPAVLAGSAAEQPRRRPLGGPAFLGPADREQVEQAATRPGRQLEAAGRQDLGIQAARRREVAGRHALHGRRPDLLHPRPRRARQRGHLRRLPAHHRLDERQGPADPDRQDQGSQSRPAAEPGLGARGQQARGRKIQHRGLQLGQGHGRHRPQVRVLHPGDRVVMARNDGYWGDKQIWDQVNYRYINNAAAAPPRCWPATWT